MSQFRRLFINKPTDPLVEISERVYVLDCSFSNNVMGEDKYKLYLGGVVSQLQVQFPDTSFMVFNFREGEERSQISDFLSQYDMPVMDYPSHYQSCPLLPLNKIHRFLRLCESWLDQRNVVLLHCERGGWPVLAFMLSGLLLHTKQFHGEKKTLEMIHSHVRNELYHLFSPLNPKPSQLRYLEYISRRNLWPSSDTPLLLDCLILKDLSLLQGRKGCRPILRVYGQDSKDRTNRSSILLFCTPKTKKHTRLYQQEECILVKLDIQCRVQGDVVLECLHLHDDLVREEMVFRIMFHTAFVRANSLMVHRDEMDILWDAKDKFPKEFKAEVLFSGSDAMVPAITTATISEDENDFDVISPEEFVEVKEIFSHVIDRPDQRRDSDSFVVVDTASDDSRDSDSFVVVDTSSDDWEATLVLHPSQAAASPPPPLPLPTYSSRSQNDSHSQTSQPPPPPPPPPFTSKRPNNGRKVLLSPPLPRPRKFVYDSTPARCYTSQSAPTSPPPPPPPPPPPFRYVNDIMLPPTWKSLYGSTSETHVACSASSPSQPPPPPFSSSNTSKANGVRIPPPPPLPYKRIAPSPSPKAPPSSPLPPTKTTTPPPFCNVRSSLPPPPPPIPFGKTSAPPPPPPPPLFRFGESRSAPLPPMYRAPHRSMRGEAPLPPPPPALPPLFRFGESRPAPPPPMRGEEVPCLMRGGAPLPPPPPPPPPGFGGRRAALIQRGPEERMRMTLLYYNHLCLLLDQVTNGY